MSCAPQPSLTPEPTPPDLRVEREPRGPLTRAERTSYTETSSHADVLQFLDSLQRLGAPIRIDTLGTSTEGRVIPYLIASRPLVASAEDARRLGRPVVYVQGNIHAGEVEGKEALLALLRDLALSPGPNALDSIVLLAVPIYNTDGNEKLAPQARNRSEQNGPAMVGERVNGQGLDLNRDYVKAEAPETRGALALFGEWDPELFVDLHTTNGSYHGYALTYSPSLTPASPYSAFTHDTLLPLLRQRTRERHGFETFPYGNFSIEYGGDELTDTTKTGWYSYDHRPRFGSNYYGLRGRIAILSEAYSHDPFSRRVASTRAFVQEILSWAAEHGSDLRDRAARADSAAVRPAGVPVRAQLIPNPPIGEVLAEDLVSTGDSTVTEPGLPPGIRRTGHIRTLRIPVADRFVPTLRRPREGSYVLGPAQGEAVELLRRHGIEVAQLERGWTGEVERFVVDSIARAGRLFQGHHEVSVTGRYVTGRETIPAGSYIVPLAQPLGVLAMYLLEPESDDGIVTWNGFDEGLAVGEPFPVRRAVGEP